MTIDLGTEKGPLGTVVSPPNRRRNGDPGLRKERDMSRQFGATR
jgi:hypothetical protein